MKENTLTTILKDELGAEHDGALWTLPQGAKISVFLATPAALFPVTKVHALQIKTDYIMLLSDDGRVFTDLSDITAVRVDEEANKKRDNAVGFGR